MSVSDPWLLNACHTLTVAGICLPCIQAELGAGRRTVGTWRALTGCAGRPGRDCPRGHTTAPARLPAALCARQGCTVKVSSIRYRCCSYACRDRYRRDELARKRARSLPPAERRAAVADLTRQGLTIERIAAQLGVTTRTIDRDRAAA